MTDETGRLDLDHWISADERLPESDGEEVEFLVGGNILRGCYFADVPFPFDEHDPKGDAHSTDEIDGWRSFPALVARVRELEASLEEWKEMYNELREVYFAKGKRIFDLEKERCPE